jgi:predicted ribosome quality control (RQC) complex YloA/Tae2 family protein
VGTDRIIEFQFSEGQYRLFVEFYAGGNVILTDRELTILVLLRTVGEAENQEQLQVGLKYGLENRQNFGGVPPLTKERVRDGLLRAVDRSNTDVSTFAKKAKRDPKDALRAALASSVTELPPMLIDHAFLLTRFDPSTKVEEVLKNDTVLNELMLVLNEARHVMTQITESEVTKGYVVARILKGVNLEHTNSTSVHSHQSRDENESLLYEDFQPFRPRKFDGLPDIRIIEILGFNATADEFFSSIETQRIESRLAERETNAKNRLDAARQAYQSKVGAWRQVQETNIGKAQVIEANLTRVQEAITAVNGLIGQGMDWVEIARLIEMEQTRQNPVAELIKLPLKLYENTITLLLGEADLADAEDNEGDETGSDVSVSDNESDKPPKRDMPTGNRLAVDIDLALSPWSNARQYYEQKKTAAVKEQKTLQSSVVALKNTEKKINADLKKGLKQEKEILRPVRHQMWYEKFYYFISSDGYLVIAGRDAQQNDILYNRYLKRGDVYVSADLKGATSVIIKNKSTMLSSPVPPSTLRQAGTVAVASSSAWESKAMMAAWWVSAEQVSKITSTGDYLPTGAFNINGIKNFLPPARLVLGFGIMFIVSEQSKTRHVKHRLPDWSAESGSRSSVGKQRLELDQPHDNDASSNESDTSSVSPLSGNGAVEVETKHEDRKGLESSDYDEPLSGNRLQGNEVPTEQPLYLQSPDAKVRMEASDAEFGGGNSEGAGDEVKSPYLFENPLQRNSIRSTAALVSDNSLRQEEAEAKSDGLGNIIDRSSSDYSEHEKEGKHLSGDSQHPAILANHRSSAKERRLLRKQPMSWSAPDQQFKDDVHIGTPLLETASEAPAIPSQNNTLSLHVRGKHGQRYKRKTKYGNQDEEDRAFALRLLGSTVGQEKAAAEAFAKAARDSELMAQKERKQEQNLRVQQTGKENEEARRLNLEAGLSQEEVREMGILENIVGTLFPEDEILDILVVCGPWDAIGSRLKWKAKLQPGNLKKGKVVREILGTWGKDVTDLERRNNREGAEAETTLRREGELIRGLREVEAVGVIPVGKCKVVLASEDKSRGSGGKAKGAGKGAKKS